MQLHVLNAAQPNIHNDEMASYLPSFPTFVKAGTASAVGFATLGAGLLYYGQNYIIYPSGFPPGSRTNVSTPLEHNMVYQDVTLETEDKVLIKSFLILQRKDVPATGGVYSQPSLHVPAKTSGEEREIAVEFDLDERDCHIAKSRPTVIIFHANAGNLGHRLPLARLFYEQMRCNVFILSYRGYGLSEGTPSEAGLRIDAQTALDFVLEHPILRSTKILLYGQSIGGAVSIDLAGRNPRSIHGLILENTFLSIPLLIPSVLPLLTSVSFLCHQFWNSAESIKLIPQETPILMLSGLMDEVVPAEHMRRLWEIATSPEENTKVEFKQAKHDVEKDRQEALDSEDEGGDEDEDSLPERETKQGQQKRRVMSRKEARGNRKWMEFSRGKHNDTCMYPEYWREVAKFVQSFDKKE